jgi:uncharacterized protein (TIGR03067 family)
MRLQPWLIGATALCLTLPATARADDAEDTLKKLAGTWKATRLVNDGREGEAEQLKDTQLVIKEDGAYILRQSQGHTDGKLTVDPSKSPARMEATYETSGGERGKAECIFKLDGDKLTVCWSDQGARPEEFSAESGSGNRLMVLERVKD